MFKDSTIPRPLNVSSEEWDAAAERGRSLAERSLLGDPVKRLQMEKLYGIEFMKARYPRVYREGVLIQ